MAPAQSRNPNMPERTFPYRPTLCPGHEWGEIKHNGTDYQFWVCDKCGRHVNSKCRFRGLPVILTFAGTFQCQKCGTTLCPLCHDHSPNVTGKDVKMRKYL